MHFDSLEFLVLLCSTFVVFHGLGRRWRVLVLILASLVFYASWNAPFVLLILLSALVDFSAAQRIFAAEKRAQARLWLTLSLAVNLGILGYFKYTNFFIESLHGVFPEVGAFSSTWNIVLPIGISFYTFQTMSYTIDVYRGQLEPTGNFAGFLLYVCFFPQLIAGPIERAPHLLPQILSAPRARIGGNDVHCGLLLIVWGLFKKAAISDNMALLVEPVYADPGAYAGPALLIATYAFAFQIFLDFSAYSDIARGAAQLFGIRLVRNFNLPYLAQSPSEFWRRWHISLSAWIRDYLYIPLGGSRGGALRVIVVLTLTMGLAGLWHGASWNFCLWGLFHGLLLVLYRVLGPALARRFCFLPTMLLAALRVLLMFHLVCLGWIFFRAATLADALLISKKLIGWLGDGLGSWSLQPNGTPLLLLFVTLFALMLWQERTDVWRRISSYQRGYCMLLGACLVAIALLKPSSSTPFIYFQF